MKKVNGVNYSKSVAARSRRERVIGMLKKQLEKNTKVLKTGEIVPLTEKDIKRIFTEIDTLKNRV